MRLSMLNTIEQLTPATEVPKAKRMPDSSTGMPSMIASELEKSNPLRPRIMPMKVPRMPREVSKPGISSARGALPGPWVTVSSLM